MNRLILAAALAATSAAPALAEGFIMGSGSWTCERARAAFITENAVDKAQVAGWLLGYWSAATFDEDKSFVDKVQEVGGTTVLQITLAECQKNPNALLYQVSDAIIRNSAAEASGEGAEEGEAPAE